MATAAELFASLNAEEPHIVINSDRSITVPDELKNIAVQYDHDIETVTFDCPRYWDGNDLSEMLFNINYVRSDKHENTYVCKNVTVDSNDSNIIHFDWTISQDVTDAAGTLTFIVCVKKSYVDGVTSQIWHSQKCDTLTILPGLKCDQAIIPSEPEYNGVQVDYNQNSETAADYIKNRPFYKESEVYNSFPDADYSTPAYDTPDGITVYRISDTPIESTNFNGAIMTGHVLSTPSEKETATISERDYSIERDDNGNKLLASLFDLIYIFYAQYPLDETTTIEPGIYSVKNDGVILCLDSIEIVLSIKQIDKSFIPPLDYASNESVESVRQSANTAQSMANTAQRMANTAKTAADSKMPKPSVIITEDASRMFINNKMTQAPDIISKNLYMTFLGCSNLVECALGSSYTRFFDVPTTNIENVDMAQNNISNLFYNCHSLKYIRSSEHSSYGSCLDLRNCIGTSNAFYGCTNLTTISSIKNIRVSLDFSDCPLDDATVNMLITNLVASDTNKTLTLKSDIVKKLTNEQLAKVPSGWTIQ